MKQIPNEISVKVLKKDMKLAGSYGDCANCIVATAMKRKFPDATVVKVGGYSFTLTFGKNEKYSYKLTNGCDDDALRYYTESPRQFTITARRD